MSVAGGCGPPARLAVIACAALALVPAAALGQTGRDTGATRSAAKPAATPRDRERDAYWAGVVAGYRASPARRTLLPGGPFGPAYGYPTPRYAPQPSYGVDYTYAPWAAADP